MSSRYLNGVVACLGDAPSGTHVVLDRPPGFYNAGASNDLLVADYTVASALEVAYPDRRFTIESDTFADVTGSPDAVRVTCSAEGATRTVHATY